MDTNESFARDLGRMEGKLDLLLLQTKTDAESTKSTLGDHNTRLTNLESWKGKAEARWTTIVTIVSIVWGIVTFWLKG